MGLFQKEPTELEIIIKETFNFEDKEEYNFEMETEGEFVQVTIPTVKEIAPEGEANANSIPTGSKLSSEQ